MMNYLHFLTLLSIAAFSFTLWLQYKHLLCMLLSLEGILLSCFFLLLSQVAKASFFCEFSLLMITYTACEAVLGLSILVYMVRSKGNDYVSSFTTQKC